ncbi:unnamed protein product, partial [marine sediment metagenome]
SQTKKLVVQIPQILLILMFKKNPLKNSGSWDLTGTPIFIDGDATGIGAKNWTWAVSQPWCSGNGISVNPYVIENVTINGLNSSNCIEIRDSDNHFVSNSFI